MPNYLDPMVRYYFTNSEPMLAEAKRIIGMNDDTKFLWNPLDLSMKTTEYEESARNKLGELFPEDAIWSKAKIWDEVLNVHLNQNHSIGLRTKFSVRVSLTAQFWLRFAQDRGVHDQGSFFIMHFKVHKDSYKNSGDCIKLIIIYKVGRIF